MPRPATSKVGPDGGVALTLAIVPMPTPRPRVSKFGAYFPAPYKAYVKTLKDMLPSPAAPLLCELDVDLHFVCKPIGKSKFTTPMGDVDNFAKSVMDTLTQQGYLGDDRQVVSLFVTKRFPVEGEAPGIEVLMRPATR